MLQECIRVFRKEYEKYGDKLILDDYIPADGTYITVKANGEMEEPVQIKLDKKTRTIERTLPNLADICHRDYQSKLIDMNKPQDPKKVIHSNNYLSFFIKKESLLNGKLTDEIIDGYYKILSNPVDRYEKYPKSKELYLAIEEEIGEVNLDRLNQNKVWIKEHIFQLEDIDLTTRDYLKIFFEAGSAEYQREGNRYLLPNIYNNNDYNEVVHGKFYGLPNDNVGMNGKKPFLASKTRKLPIPYLISLDDAIMQKKFFDHLMNLAAKGRYNIYIDLANNKIEDFENGEMPSESSQGIFLRIQKGKEIEIHHQDVTPGYRYKLKREFEYKNVLKASHKSHPGWGAEYHTYANAKALQELLNEVLFSKYLKTNYFTKAEDLSLNSGYLKRSILFSRDAIFSWIYKGVDSGVAEILDSVTLDLIKGSFADGYSGRAIRQFNLRWSLISYFNEGGMEDVGQIVQDAYENLKQKMQMEETGIIDSDREYFFAVGQLANYLASLSKARTKNYNLLSPFFNARNDILIKERLIQYLKKYGHDIAMHNKRFNNIYSMVIGYSPEGRVNQDLIIAGAMHSSLIYYKEEK